MKVLGMGNALIDVLAIISNDELLDSLNLPKGSMQLIDEERFKIINNELNKLETSIVAGGSASNTIIGLSLLGIDSSFLGRIGKDRYGKLFKEDLISHHVTPLLIESEERTGIASTFLSKDGERTFGTYLGTAAKMTAQDLNKSLFEGYDYFYIEGYLVQNYELIRTAIELAKGSGCKVILDLASYNIVEESRDFLLNIIPDFVDILFSNEDEAKALLNNSPEEAVSILSQSVEIAIVKTGAKGSWVKQGNDKEFIPALKVNCIDSTGAGDLYASGFIYGLINNLSLKKCGEIGTLLAGNVIQSIGARIESSTWPELIKEINNLQ